MFHVQYCNIFDHGGILKNREITLQQEQLKNKVKSQTNGCARFKINFCNYITSFREIFFTIYVFDSRLIFRLLFVRTKVTSTPRH